MLDYTGTQSLFPSVAWMQGGLSPCGEKISYSSKPLWQNYLVSWEKRLEREREGGKGKASSVLITRTPTLTVIPRQVWLFPTPTPLLILFLFILLTCVLHCAGRLCLGLWAVECLCLPQASSVWFSSPQFLLITYRFWTPLLSVFEIPVSFH